MTTQDSSTYWKLGRVELRAAGFDPDRAAQTSAVVTIASAYTNAHRCNNRVRAITDLLVELAKDGEYLSRKYVRLKLRAVQKRERSAATYLQRVKDCLRRVIDYAASKNVRLGLENRRGYEEIPTEREFPALFDEMDSPQIGYWHDFGHAQIKENLAFLDHAEWLRRIAQRTLGCHVQDCVWPAQDHQPPFAGDVDLERLVPLLPSNCLFVWEMSPRKTADEIRRSMQIWKQHFGK